MGGREKGGKGERGDDGLSDGDNSGEDETSKRRSLIFLHIKIKYWSRHSTVGI